VKIVYFFISLFLLNNVYGFGVSPAEFDLNLRNGEVVERSFYVFNNKNENKIFNISSYDAEFLNFSSFLIEANKNSEKEVYFLVDVPAYLKNHSYKGRIYVGEIKDSISGVNLNTLLGIKINLNVLSDYIGVESFFKSEEDFKSDEQDSENEIYNEIIFDEPDNSDFDEIIKDRYVLLFFALVSIVIVLSFSFVLIKLIFKR
jgi:hypothetical protein